MLVKTVLPFRFSVALKCARSTYRCVLTSYNGPSVLACTQPVELFGRIGRRTRYHAFVALNCFSLSTSTMLCVPSVVIVSSLVTARADAFGCLCATTRFKTCAQCATFLSVSVDVNG